MNFNGQFVCDRTYYQTFYRDWRKQCSRWNNFDLVLGLACLAAGIFVVLDPARRGPLGFVLLAIGAWEVPRAVSGRYRWVSKQLASEQALKKIEFAIDGNNFTFARKGEKQTLPKSPIQKLIVADEGILLMIKEGKTVYLPRYAFPSTNEFAACATYLTSKNQETEKLEQRS